MLVSRVVTPEAPRPRPPTSTTAAAVVTSAPRTASRASERSSRTAAATPVAIQLPRLKETASGNTRKAAAAYIARRSRRSPPAPRSARASARAQSRPKPTTLDIAMMSSAPKVPTARIGRPV